MPPKRTKRRPNVNQPNVRGENIRRLREKESMTQAHLAEAARLTERTVQRAEAGEPVTAETLRALAGAFNVDLSLLSRTHADASFESLKARYEVVPLEVLTRATQLSVVERTHTMTFDAPDLDTAEQEDAAAQFHQALRDVADLAGELGPAELHEQCKSLLREADAMREMGLAVSLGIRRGRLGLKTAAAASLGLKAPVSPVQWDTLVVVVAKAGEVKTHALWETTAPPW
jgi:transcriptional regulator with XRE-family HTH domain